MDRISLDAFMFEWTCSSSSPADFSYIYLTSDGGQTWNSWLATGNESFLNPVVGWRLFSQGQAQSNQLQQTTNGGLAWKTIKTVAWHSAQFDFVSDSIGWAVVTGSDINALVSTSDGGKTWKELKPWVTP